MANIIVDYGLKGLHEPRSVVVILFGELVASAHAVKVLRLQYQ